MKQKIGSRSDRHPHSRFPGIGDAVGFIANLIGKDVLIDFAANDINSASFYKTLQRIKKENDINLESVDGYILLICRFFDRLAARSPASWLTGKHICRYISLYFEIITSIEPILATDKQICQFLITVFLYLSIYDYTDYCFQAYSSGKTPENIFPSGDPFWFLWDYTNDSLQSPIQKIFEWIRVISDHTSMRKLSDFIHNKRQFAGIDQDNYYRNLLKWCDNTVTPEWKSIREILDIDWIVADIQSFRARMESYFVYACISQNLWHFVGAAFGQSKMRQMQNDICALFMNLGSFKADSETRFEISDTHLRTLLSCGDWDDNTIFQSILNAIAGFDAQKSHGLSDFVDDCMQMKDQNCKVNKTSQDLILARRLLKRIQENEPWGACYSYIVDLQQARFHNLCGDILKAAKFYKKAFDEGKYRAASYSEKIIEEGIVTAAYAKDRFMARQLHRWGYAVGLVNEVWSELEHYTLDQAQKLFYSYFNPRTFYPTEKTKKECRRERKMLKRMRFGSKEKGRVRSGKQFANLNGSSVNKKIYSLTPRARTPLMLAAASLGLQEICRLMSLGADAGLTASDGSNALLLAMQMYCAERRKDSTSELALEGRLVVSKLIEKMQPIDLNARTLITRTTALQAAIDAFDSGIVGILLDRGADVDQRCSGDLCRPLYYVINQLYRYDLYETDREKLKMLPFANPGSLLMKNVPAVPYIDRYFETDRIENYRSMMEHSGSDRVLDFMFRRKRFSRSELVKSFYILCENGAAMDCPENNSFTPLMMACEAGLPGIAEHLLRQGANPNTQTDEGATPLMYAISGEHWATASVLLGCRLEASINAQFYRDKNTALHIMARQLPQGRQLGEEIGSVISGTLAQGPNLAITDRQGKTVEEICVQRNLYEFLSLLPFGGLKQ